MRGQFIATVGLVIGLLATAVMAGDEEKTKTLTDKDSGTKIKIANQRSTTEIRMPRPRAEPPSQE